MPKPIQRSNWLYFSLITLLIWVIIFAVGCSPTSELAEIPPEPRPTIFDVVSTLPASPSETPSLTTTIKSETPEVYHFLLLGGDQRAHRLAAGYQSKTDVMLLISLIMDDPIQAKVIQIPRNLYVPVRNFPDMYAFNVFGLEHWQGLHYWWQEVFGIDLTAAFYVNMDNFVSVIDDLGGLWIKHDDPPASYLFDGEQTLAYLRDNENNWGCKHYDCQGRQFRTLNALFEAGRDRFMSDSVVAAGMALKEWGNLIESDISSIEQFVWIFKLGWAIHNSTMEVSYHQLAAPNIQRGPVPLDPGRAEVPVVDLSEWISDILRH